MENQLEINKITREINFCKENQIDIGNDRLETHLNEVLKSIWSIFFLIYDVEEHFDFLALASNKQQAQIRFQKIFREQKADEFDIPFNIKEEAINRRF